MTSNSHEAPPFQCSFVSVSAGCSVQTEPSNPQMRVKVESPSPQPFRIWVGRRYLVVQDALFHWCKKTCYATQQSTLVWDAKTTEHINPPPLSLTVPGHNPLEFQTPLGVCLQSCLGYHKHAKIDIRTFQRGGPSMWQLVSLYKPKDMNMPAGVQAVTPEQPPIHQGAASETEALCNRFSCRDPAHQDGVTTDWHVYSKSTAIKFCPRYHTCKQTGAMCVCMYSNQPCVIVFASRKYYHHSLRWLIYLHTV